MTREFRKSKYTFIVTKEEANIPLRKVVKKKYGFSSRFMSKLKKNELIYLDGISVPGWVTAKEGETVSVKMPEERSDFPPENIPIDAAFEDEDILIINKQPGVTVHPTNGCPDHTLANGLMPYMDKNGDYFKIRFVNRLDRDTTGLLIVAKNSPAQDNITKQMQHNEVEKEYYAFVKGNIAEDTTINLPIGRRDDEPIRRCIVPDGQRSITHVHVVQNYPSGCALVRLRLETGRTHQIRVHMAATGHPLLGDELYGGPCDIFSGRQALHAFSLKLNHPFSGERMEIEAPLPNDLANLKEKLEKDPYK